MARKSTPPEVCERIVAAVRAGVDLADAAIDAGVSLETARSICKRHGITIPKPPRAKQRNGAGAKDALIAPYFTPERINARATKLQDAREKHEAWLRERGLLREEDAILTRPPPLPMNWAGPASRVRPPRREALRDDVASLEVLVYDADDEPRDLVDLLVGGRR